MQTVTFLSQDGRLTRANPVFLGIWAWRSAGWRLIKLFTTCKHFFFSLCWTEFCFVSFWNLRLVFACSGGGDWIKRIDFVIFRTILSASWSTCIFIELPSPVSQVLPLPSFAKLEYGQNAKPLLYPGRIAVTPVFCLSQTFADCWDLAKSV